MSEQPSPPATPLVVLMPVFNDWPAVGKLLPALDAVLLRHGLEADLVIIDDGSTVRPTHDLCSTSYGALRRVGILELRRNLGHQRAIAIGLAYVEARIPCEAVLVMDGDGEDDPADVPRLLHQSRLEGGDKIVFAERTRRSESHVFRASYAAYRLLHYLLTGHKVRVGNFSVIPRPRLASLVVVSEMWNHYAAAAFASRQPRATIPTRRASRLDGRSSMDFVQLVIHGFRAISVFRELVGVRLLLASVAMTAVAIAGMAGAVGLRHWTTLDVPQWAVDSLAVVLIVLAQAILLAFFLTFTLLGARDSASLLPARDYPLFVAGFATVHPKPDPTPSPPTR